MRIRKQIRKAHFNYAADNLFFVTCNCKDWQHHFGEIQNGMMIKSKSGEIVEEQWIWLFRQYPYIKSHEFVVMPNHFHGVIEILKSYKNHEPNQPENEQNEKGQFEACPEIGGELKRKSLSELMGAFKTTSSKRIHLAGNIQFAWHRSFHESVINSTESYYNIIKYIRNNPKNWNKK